MATGDDPFKKAAGGAFGHELGRTSNRHRAAQGLRSASDNFEQSFDGQRHIDVLLGKRPGLFEDLVRGHHAFSDLLKAQPTIFEDIARKQSAFDEILSGGVITQVQARLGAVDVALVRAHRAAGTLAGQAALERLVGARAAIPGHVVDSLARTGALSSLIDRISSPGADLGQRFITQMEGISRAIAEATGSLPSRADLALRFPSIVPPLRLPTAPEIAGVDLVAASGLRHRDATWAQATAAQIAAIDMPWVRDDRPDLAIEGFAALKALTEVVSGAEPAAPRVIQLVRADLGDYRRVDPSDDAVEDPMLVAGLRFARGFDIRLASLPMALAGSVFATFGMMIGPTPEADADELDDAITWMIRQLERKFRAFVDRQMRSGVGERWIHRRVHKKIRDEWARRRQADVDAGRTPGALFDYADFGEYRAIIEQGDNWRDVFQAVFRVKTAIGETLTRLGVIRNPVAHVRPLSIEDLLVLRVEGRRLYVWMGEPVP